MTKLDPIVFLQLPIIRRIIDDEIWLESERRGYAVTPNDHVVLENVCQVVLRIGRQMREASERKMASAPMMIPYQESQGAA